MNLRPHSPRGVTLVELIITLMIVGMVSAMAAQLVSAVVSGQQDARGRATLAMKADLALGRVGDELHAALPNSLRLGSSGAGTWAEFVPVVDAGIYRRAPDQASGTPGDTWNPADGSDTGFDVLGHALAQPSGTVALVAGNMGTPDADAYAGTSRRGSVVVSANGLHLAFAAGAAMPAAGDSSRFFLVGTPVTLACVPNGSGGFDLVRYSGYGWFASQPVGAAAGAWASAQSSVLLDGLSRCAMGYGSGQVNIGLLTISLGLGVLSSGVQMDLLNQLVIDNTP
jgi:MSHA biogenesis protein MshO